MTERVDAAIRRILLDDPTIHVCYTFAIRPDSFHRGNDVLFLHPCHEAVIAAARNRAQLRVAPAAPRPTMCELCGHAPVGLRPGGFARLLSRLVRRRFRLLPACATFEYDKTSSMHRYFCRCSGPAHRRRLVGRGDAIEAGGSGW